MPDGSRGEDLIRLAYSTLEIKSFDGDARTFEGIASTPSVDSGGDIMDPFGAKFTLPMPLLWQHGKGDIKDPIGWVTDAKATAAGIFVKGRFAQVDSPPSLKDQLDRSWALVKAKLVRGLSIGWRPIEGKPEKNGVIRWLKWGWHELSAVAIPMNTEASIQTIKSIATAAPGRAIATSPGASGKSSTKPRSNTMQGIQERLTETEGARAEKAARMQELTTKCEGDFDKLEAVEQKEFDGLNADVEQLDRDIARYRGSLRAANGAKAIPSYAGTDPDVATRVRYGDFQMKSNLPKGTRWTRAVMAKAFAIKNHMSMSESADYAKSVWPDTPEVAQYLRITPAMRAKANPATGASGNWAEPLNVANTIEGEFIDLLYPATIIGRLGLRPAPFNVKMLRRTTGVSTAGWVGKAVAKPVGENAWDTVTVDQSKIADIVVLTDDQVMTSHIDNVEAVRMDLIEQISMFADEQFTDPSVAAVAGTNPASILNGVNNIVSNGATAADLRADVYALQNKFAAANIPLSGVTLIMSEFLASGISMMVNALGQSEFPEFNGDGRLGRMRVVVSNNVGGSSSGSNLIAVAPREILLAQNGGIRVDMSREATIDMAGGNSPTYSLFQKNSVALRCEWWVSWKKARDAAAQYVSGAAYAPQPA